jgi:hypothetical protein
MNHNTRWHCPCPHFWKYNNMNLPVQCPECPLPPIPDIEVMIRAYVEAYKDNKLRDEKPSNEMLYLHYLLRVIDDLRKMKCDEGQKIC